MATTLRTTPLFPVTQSNATTYPAIQFREQLQLVRQAEVAHPAANVPSQLTQATLHRDPSATASDLAYAMLEAFDGLGRDVDVAARLGEREPEELELAARDNTTLFFVDDQF